MSNLEHYFENLLFYGEDVKDECNKKSLTEQERAVVEQCANYVVYALFSNRDEFIRWFEHKNARCGTCIYSSMDDPPYRLKCSVHQKQVNNDDLCECYE